MGSGGYDAQHYLSGWFWLTDGWYMFNTPDGPLPISHPDSVEQYHLTEDQWVGIDYQVARLWMDLQDTLSVALEPPPAPLAGWVASRAWLRWIEDTLVWWQGLDDQDRRASQPLSDAPFTTKGWWSVHHLDIGYLVAAPDGCFWHIHDTVTMEWDTRACRLYGVPYRVETAGRQVFSLAAFEQEVTGF